MSETLKKCTDFSNNCIYIKLDKHCRKYDIINELINLKLFDKYGNYINYDKINILSNGTKIFEINNNKIDSIRKIFIDIIGKYPGNDIFTNIIEKYIGKNNVLNLPIRNLTNSDLHLEIYVEIKPFYYYLFLNNTFLYNVSLLNNNILWKDSFVISDGVITSKNNGKIIVPTN